MCLFPKRKLTWTQRFPELQSLIKTDCSGQVGQVGSKLHAQNMRRLPHLEKSPRRVSSGRLVHELKYCQCLFYTQYVT
jgi:hypothetical protein